MSRPSIRRTLLLRSSGGIGLLFAILSVTIYLTVRQSLYNELNQSLHETASILANQIEYENGEIIFEWQEGMGTNSSISERSLFQYWNINSDTTTRSPALGDHDLPRFTGPDGLPDIETISIPGYMENARAIGLRAYPFVLPEEKLEISNQGEPFDSSQYPHTLVVARDLTPVLSTLNSLALILSISTAAAFVIGFFVISGAIRRSLSAIGELAEDVRNRSENQLDSAIVLPGGMPSELASLAESFDQLLNRVAAIRSRERDFIRHASHELRTPIAELTANTELALSRPRTNSEYVAHLESCASTSADLGELVKRLSALARVGQTTSPEKIEPTDTLRLLQKCMASFMTRFSHQGITVDVDFPDDLPKPLAEPVLLSLIFNNLLDNAASYAKPQSKVSISAEFTASLVNLRFTNEAEGLPPNVDRLFEPLFRRDTSRTETPDFHLGIGLTLSQAAAEAMQGSLNATKHTQRLISFNLFLPR